MREANRLKELRRAAFAQVRQRREEEMRLAMEKALQKSSEQVARSKIRLGEMAEMLNMNSAVRGAVLEANRRLIKEEEERRQFQKTERTERAMAQAAARRQAFLTARVAVPRRQFHRDLAKRQAARMERIREAEMEVLRQRLGADAPSSPTFARPRSPLGFVVPVVPLLQTKSRPTTPARGAGGRPQSAAAAPAGQVLQGCDVPLPGEKQAAEAQRTPARPSGRPATPRRDVVRPLRMQPAPPPPTVARPAPHSKRRPVGGFKFVAAPFGGHKFLEGGEAEAAAASSRPGSPSGGRRFGSGAASGRAPPGGELEEPEAETTPGLDGMAIRTALLAVGTPSRSQLAPGGDADPGRAVEAEAPVPDPGAVPWPQVAKWAEAAEADVQLASVGHAAAESQPQSRPQPQAHSPSQVQAWGQEEPPPAHRPQPVAETLPLRPCDPVLRSDADADAEGASSSATLLPSALESSAARLEREASTQDRGFAATWADCARESGHEVPCSLDRTSTPPPPPAGEETASPATLGASTALVLVPAPQLEESVEEKAVVAAATEKARLEVPNADPQWHGSVSAPATCAAPVATKGMLDDEGDDEQEEEEEPAIDDIGLFPLSGLSREPAAWELGRLAQLAAREFGDLLEWAAAPDLPDPDTAERAPSEGPFGAAWEGRAEEQDAASASGRDYCFDDPGLDGGASRGSEREDSPRQERRLEVSAAEGELLLEEEEEVVPEEVTGSEVRVTLGEPGAGEDAAAPPQLREPSRDNLTLFRPRERIAVEAEGPSEEQPGTPPAPKLAAQEEGEALQGAAAPEEAAAAAPPPQASAHLAQPHRLQLQGRVPPGEVLDLLSATEEAEAAAFLEALEAMDDEAE